MSLITDGYVLCDEEFGDYYLKLEKPSYIWQRNFAEEICDKIAYMNNRGLYNHPETGDLSYEYYFFELLMNHTPQFSERYNQYKNGAMVSLKGAEIVRVN